MKLLFKKDDQSHISVFRKIDGHEHSFSYIDMIKDLIASKSMEEPEILGNFSEAETKSIKRMVDFINKEIGEADEDKLKAE